MKKIPLLLSILFVLAANILSGQITPIQLDRPDQTECPFITPARYIQIESGFTIENANAQLTNYSSPTVLWKYGLNDHFEFRLITELATEKNNLTTQTGLSPVTIGFKTSICKENGILPATSFIGHITTANAGSKYFHTKYIAPSFRFTMQHTLSSRFSLAYNLGAEWNGEDAEQTYIYTLTTGISITDKLGGYLEIYGFAPNEHRADHRFDGGLTYLINNNCMVDLSGGMGITSNAPKNYLALGFSYRFKTFGHK